MVTHDQELRPQGLEEFFYTGSVKGIQANHSNRLRLILDLLDAADTAQSVGFPGSRLHPLKGDLRGHWSLKVSGNWRITFRFEDGDAHVVNYQDCH